MTTEPVRLSRAELYEEVWREPMVRVAAHYGLSDVGLAEICRKLHVPVPYRGYWRNKELGHPSHRTPLSKLPPSTAAHAGQAGHPGDAGGQAGDRADFARAQLRRVRFARLADGGEGLVKNVLQAFSFHVHCGSNDWLRFAL